jgi:predicted fused transcriptional regulator/phosphomethylpyrimidine kinase
LLSSDPLSDAFSITRSINNFESITMIKYDAELVSAFIQTRLAGASAGNSNRNLRARERKREIGIARVTDILPFSVKYVYSVRHSGKECLCRILTPAN